MQEIESIDASDKAEIVTDLRVEEVAAVAGRGGYRLIVPPRAVVKAPGATKVEVVDQRRYANFSSNTTRQSNQQYSPARSVDSSLVSFSLAFAKENEVSDAIVHRELQKVQLHSPSRYARHGKQYTPGYNGQLIFDALGCFEHRSIVYDTAARLARNHHLEPETWEDLDVDAWYDYPLSHSFHVPAPLTNGDLLTIRSVEAKRYGLINAVLLAAYRDQPAAKIEQGVEYKRMSAKELALVLPYDPQTIGKYLRQFIKNEVLIVHPTCPKYFHCELD